MEEMAGEGSISIISDTGSMSKLIRIIPFAKLDKLEIGILQFEPRSAGIRELYLQLNLEPGFSNSYKLFFARQDGLLEYGYISSTFLMGRQGVVEQAGFRIAFEGWGPGPNAQLYNPTEVEPSSSTTPNSPLPISTPFIRPLTTISPEASVYRTVSLRIEDIHNHRVHYLTIQMISNGQVLGLFDDFLVESEPMPTETKMDYSAPYPMTPQPTSTSPYP